MISKSSLLLRLAPRILNRPNLQRNFGASSVALQEAAGPIDPVQKLFADKVNQLF